MKERMKDWDEIENCKEIFHFRCSLRPFIIIEDTNGNKKFLDIDEGVFYTEEELKQESLSFFSKANDENFNGVRIVGKINWE